MFPSATRSTSSFSFFLIFNIHTFAGRWIREKYHHRVMKKDRFKTKRLLGNFPERFLPPRKRLFSRNFAKIPIEMMITPPLLPPLVVDSWFIPLTTQTPSSCSKHNSKHRTRDDERKRSFRKRRHGNCARVKKISSWDDFFFLHAPEFFSADFSSFEGWLNLYTLLIFWQRTDRAEQVFSRLLVLRFARPELS